MEASVVDLRYNMKNVIEALERREVVKVLYHGKVKGTIIPESVKQKKKVIDHPFFGMNREEKESVSEKMEELRRGRYDSL